MDAVKLLLADKIPLKSGRVKIRMFSDNREEKVVWNHFATERKRLLLT